MGRLGLVVVALTLAIAPGGGWQPAAGGGDAPVREDGILRIVPQGLPSRGEVCLGDRIPLSFAVENASPGLEVPLPVFEAMVSVSDDQGRVREALTNGAGNLRLDWPAEREGPVVLTVKARKEYYTAAPPVRLSITVAACEWHLGIDFHEEYAVISEMGFVVGADVAWRGTLKASAAQGEDAGSDITLAGGSGTYTFYASDKIQAPLHWAIDPPVAGTWDVKLQGHSDGRTVWLDFSTVPTDYPKYVPMKLTDYSNRGIEINYKPPAPVSGGNGLFLELNHLANISLPAAGGAVNLTSGMSCFFYTDERTGYSLSILLYPLKKGGATLPARPVAGLVP